jgi:hypothetical protein
MFIKSYKIGKVMKKRLFVESYEKSCLWLSKAIKLEKLRKKVIFR